VKLHSASAFAAAIATALAATATSLSFQAFEYSRVFTFTPKKHPHAWEPKCPWETLHLIGLI